MNDQDISLSTHDSNSGPRRDYRDDLRELLDKAHSEHGITRYRICRHMGMDSGTMSNVLSKRRHFSLDKLETLLHLLGYRISFAPTKEGYQMKNLA